jgi:tetratricopeptide (TPR) repeat protein
VRTLQRWLAPLLAVAAFAGARFARESAAAQRPTDTIDEPFAPSPDAAPIVAAGYRELAADVQWIKFLGYFGGVHSTADGIAGVVESIVALDPRYHRIYEHGARAMTMADEGVTQQTYLRAIAVLERGIQEFPDDWRLYSLASEIYSQDLKTEDPEQRRAWQERAIRLVESAVRKPGAPPETATWAAHMQSKLGQKQRAIAGLREMILLTTNVDSRKRLIDKLAYLEDADSEDLASELYAEQHKFIAAWRRERPAVPASIYILIGPHLGLSYDPTELATGGRDLVTTSADDPSSP